jgi:hypothetical protein
MFYVREVRICCVLAIFERRRGRLGSKISGCGMAVYFAMSGLPPGRVKTRKSKEGAELFSLFSSFDGGWQSCSFLIQRKRDKLSTRKFDVGVFTQPAPEADTKRKGRHVRWVPVSTPLNPTLHRVGCIRRVCVEA